MNEKVKKIQRESLIVDAHLDLLYDVDFKRRMGETKVIENRYLPEFKEGGVNLVVSSIYIDDTFLPEMALRKAMNQVSVLYSEIDESPDKIMLCKSFKDIEKAIEEEKIGIMLSFEGVEPLYDDLSLLRVFYELGVRLVGLTWSRRNFAADGCSFKKGRELTRGGLTDFGVRLVEEAENLGMIIDVSHLNDEGFWDIMEITKKPIIASHSNTRTLVNIPRNLTDDQIKAIASKDGVIGMNVASLLVADSDKNANIEHLLNHVDQIAKVVGVKHVGLGFDFCDRLFENSSPQSLEKLPRKPFDVMKGHDELDIFIDGLINRGYGEDEIKMIIGENFLRLYRQIL
ncbi:dipeptidase [Wukongibacter baidiensis]|uniref:dipeptidase n=1 Tax=Wukongibacter baidiensis TaxID=1723361 RepID=UPI003D7F34C1